MQISTEGKIGITLTLVGLLGGGAIMRYPDQAWIGTAMMAVAVFGFACLVWHYFRTRCQVTAEQRKPHAAIDASTHVLRKASIDVAVDLGEPAGGMDGECCCLRAGGGVAAGQRREGRHLG